MALIFLSAGTGGFVCGYGLREWISARRRKEAFLARGRESTSRMRDPQLSTLENQIADTTSEIKALRDEVRSVLAAMSGLLEWKSEVAQPSEKPVAPSPQPAADDGRALKTFNDPARADA